MCMVEIYVDLMSVVVFLFVLVSFQACGQHK